jgi:peptide/nickel transport system ATP-binding protein
VNEKSPLLELEGLGVSFPVGGMLTRSALRAVHRADIVVDRGEIVAIVGESGSGKSTIARLVCRLEQPTEGRILLDGVDILARERRRASRTYRRRVQMIFQDPFGSLNPVHKVGYHVARPLAIHGRAARREVRAKTIELLETVGLRPGEDFVDEYPHSLSGGQRQRVAIARALASEPDLIFADEPTSMLDVSIRMDVLRLLGRLRDERGTAIVFITHDLAAARTLADRIIVLYAGQLVEEAPADALIQGPAHPYAKLLVAAAPKPGRTDGLDRPLPANPGAPRNVDPPPGCPFAARCREVMDVCRSTMPDWTTPADGAEGHRTRCHLHGDATPGAQTES